MIPVRYVQLETTSLGSACLPVKLIGEKQLPTVFRAVILDCGIASSISRTTFRKLFPSLEHWPHDKTPLVRMKVHFPQTTFSKFNLRTSASFDIAEDSVFSESEKDVILLDISLAMSIGHIMVFCLI